MQRRGLWPEVTAVLWACLTLAAGCTPAAPLAPPATVGSVDLQRYLGTWHEIARLDERFQRGCFASQAHYWPSDAGQLEVINSCRSDGLDGPWRQVRGRAQVQPGSAGARLKVNFFGPFWGDYWVIERDAAYTWAAVGDPRRRHLWILSRTPQMDPSTYQQLLQALAAKHFPVDQLIPTPQPPPADADDPQPLCGRSLEQDVARIAQAPRPRGSPHHAATAQLIYARLAHLGFTDLAGGPLRPPAVGAGGVGEGSGATVLNNIVGVKLGHQLPDQHVLLSAHYDSVPGSVGADDNASGVAGVLAVAAQLARRPHTRSLLVALWDGEEEGLLGSALWAAAARRAELDLRDAYVLEMIGRRRGERHSQTLPGLLALGFPLHALQIWWGGMRGDFVAVVGDSAPSAGGLRRAGAGLGLQVRHFRVPRALRPAAVWTDLGRSDHASLWRAGYSASMITDTANFRSANYHTPADTPACLDTAWLRQVAAAVAAAVAAQLQAPRAG